jgi:hypothetical protein
MYKVNAASELILVKVVKILSVILFNVQEMAILSMVSITYNDIHGVPFNPIHREVDSGHQSDRERESSVSENFQFFKCVYNFI